jgi:2-C-methyl-D-erythritol 4-phosphate cytidylyltransferase
MNIAIILSGGVGSRMGLNQPKQYVEVNNQPIICYSIKTFLENDNTDAIVIGVADEWKDFVMENVAKLAPTKPIFYAPAGETRQYTIYNCLQKIRENGYSDNDIVVIHDAARPLLTHDLINKCCEGCRTADCIMPVIGVKDTIYLSEDGKNITSLLNRSHLWAGQAPESFVFGKYIQLHDEMSRKELLKINGSTELAFKQGLNCQMIEGDPMNFKITTPEDLSNFEAIVNKN